GCFRVCHVFFFSSRRRHTRSKRDWSSDVCSSDLRSSFELSGDGGMLQYDSGSSAPIQVDRFSETGMIPASDTVLNEPVLKRQLNEAVTSAVSKNASDGLDHYTYAMEIVKAVTESVQKRESVALKGGATS